MSFYGTDYPDPLAEQERQSAIDRRSLELHSQILDVDGLRKIEPPSPLIENYLFHDSLAWLGGKPGHVKTFIAVEIACCVGTGTPWHGHQVAQGPSCTSSPRARLACPSVSTPGPSPTASPSRTSCSCPCPPSS